MIKRTLVNTLHSDNGGTYDAPSFRLVRIIRERNDYVTLPSHQAGRKNRMERRPYVQAPETVYLTRHRFVSIAIAIIFIKKY